MHHHLVLRVVSKTLLPAILLFALYVQFHGDYGPGGGFQAGVIVSAAFVLYGLVFGLERVRMLIPEFVIRAGAAAGVLIYAGVGFTTLVLGGNFLDYNVLSSHGHEGQHWGIFLVELGVLMTVSSVMLLIFYTFADRTKPISDEDW